MIYFASYPRAGRIWIEHRLFRLAYLLRDQIKEKHGIDIPDNAKDHKIEVAMRSVLKGTHFCYDPFILHGIDDINEKFKRKDKVFLLLRHAGNCTYSLYFYLQNKIKSLPSEYKDNVNKFLQGPFGAPRYINFLRKCNRIGNLVGSTNVMFYEDMNNTDSVRTMTGMLGLDNCSLSDEELQAFIEETDVKLNTHGTKHDSKPVELLEEINRKVVNSKISQFYSQRYA